MIYWILVVRRTAIVNHAFWRMLQCASLCLEGTSSSTNHPTINHDTTVSVNSTSLWYSTVYHAVSDTTMIVYTLNISTAVSFTYAIDIIGTTSRDIKVATFCCF